MASVEADRVGDVKKDVESIIIAKNNDDTDPNLLEEMRQKVLSLLDNMSG